MVWISQGETWATSPATTFTYDNNGNTVTKSETNGTTQYAWDFENRLTSVTLPNGAGVVTFKYDPFGRRIQKTTSAGTTNYLYDGANVVDEYNASATLMAKYSQQQNVDEQLAMWRNNTTTYYQADSLGSITSITDSTGAAQGYYSYESFGKIIGSPSNVTSPYRYAGRDWDSETSLYYNRARYYDADSGRFLSEDPIRFMGGFDFYAYVLNNPILFRDPYGHQNEVPNCYPDCVHSQQERIQMQQEHDKILQQLEGPAAPTSGPAKFPPPPNKKKCKTNNHDCLEAYVETAWGGVVIVGDVALAWYVLPELFAETSLEGTLEGAEAVAHGVPFMPGVPGVIAYWDGVHNISKHCRLLVDYFYGTP